MRMPEFTAESSLHKSRQVWRAARAAAPTGGSMVLVPQFCLRQGNVINCVDCFEYQGDSYCWTHTVRLPTLF